MSIKISVITICRNAEDTIEATISSVLNQSYDNLEYIIVDGVSTDSTLDIIHRMTDGDSRVRLISEPDKGLYDAMNKGARFATGDYVEFLNSGDSFAGGSVVEQMAEFISGDLGTLGGSSEIKAEKGLDSFDKSKNEQGNIYFGNICYIHPDGHTEHRNYGASCGKAIYYLTGDCINHQAIFASRDCFSENTFDLSYKICADRDWMMRCSRNKCRFVATNLLICNYSLDADSVSIRDKKSYDREAAALIKKHYPVGYPIYAIFEFCRNNKVLAGILHSVYKLLYIRKTK